MKIITNNPLVHAEFPEKADLFDTDTRDILLKAQNYVHLGAELMSSNLASEQSSGGNPHKSLIIIELGEHKGMTTDFYSLTLIENAIKDFGDSSLGFDGYDDKALKDFQAADFEQLKGCLEKFD